MDKFPGRGYVDRLLHLRSFSNQVFLLYFLENIYHFLLQPLVTEFDGPGNTDTNQANMKDKWVVCVVNLNDYLSLMNIVEPQLNEQPQGEGDRDHSFDFTGFLVNKRGQRDEYLIFCLYINVFEVCVLGDRSAGRYPLI